MGADIVPYKTCSYDCIYCQLGRTTDQTVKRRSFVSVDSVMNQIVEIVNQNSDIDYITFSGSGEPTLSQDLSRMIERAKSLTQIPVAVLTNGSLLWDSEVRKDLSGADLVVPSLDAVSDEVFRRVNRPVGGLDVKKVLRGIKDFCSEFTERVYLEIMLVKGINDSEEEIKKLDRFIGELKLDKIQLNTVVRPPGDPEARPLGPEDLLAIKALFDPSLPIEIVADFDRMTSKAYHKDLERAILDLLERRPTRKDEMATALGVHPNEIAKYLQVLERGKRIRRVRTESRPEDYYAHA